MFADPMQPGAAPLGDLDEVRGGAGFPVNRSRRGSTHRQRHHRKTKETNKRQYRYAHVALR